MKLSNAELELIIEGRVNLDGTYEYNIVHFQTDVLGEQHAAYTGRLPWVAADMPQVSRRKWDTTKDALCCRLWLHRHGVEVSADQVNAVVKRLAGSAWPAS